MKFISMIALCMISLASHAQSAAQDTTIYQTVDTVAQFPKGDAGWQQFLNKHFTYSRAAMQKEIQGVVVVQYVVEIDGS